MVVQLDELQKDTIYRILAPKNLESCQPKIECLIQDGARVTPLFALLDEVFEAGRLAGYQDGVRWGENYGAETAIKLFQQAVRKNGIPAANSEG